MKNDEPVIEVAPATEKSKRINKAVIAVVVLVLGVLVFYLVFGGKSEKKAPKPEAATATSSSISKETLRQLDDEINEQNRYKKPGTPDTTSRVASPSQPKQTLQNTESNRMQLEQERRAMDKRQRDLDAREKDTISGQRSGIFFVIPSQSQKSQDKPSKEPSVNRYYNDGYIEVVGGGK